jgi:glycosyltransferase involved in cell wall biosynthesis
MIRQLTVSLGRKHVETRIFVPSPNPVPKLVQVNGIEVIRSKLHFEIASCGFALTSISEFKRQVEWADIVHYHFPWPFADLLHLIANVKKPTVVTYHSDIVRQSGLMKLYQPLMNHFLDKASAVVATSERYRETSSVLSKLKNPASAVPIGIDQGSYPIASKEVLATVETKYGKGFFFFIGMLRYYKGLHILLDACRGTTLPVVIAGTGPLEAELRKRVEDEGLSHVQFAGRVNDEEKMALIQLSLGMVFPSHLRSEAFGVTLVEGLMMGKPLVCAEVGTGTSFVNQHDQTGYVVEADNSTELRDAMQKLIDIPELTKQLGLNARERFEAFFTADQMADGYLKIYQRVLAA